MADDYKLLMSILAKNMSEGADERTTLPPTPVKKIGENCSFAKDKQIIVKLLYLHFFYPDIEYIHSCM